MGSGGESRVGRAHGGVGAWIAPAAAIAALWLLAAPGQACEAPVGLPTLALERCLLLEQGARANLEGRYAEADAAWQALRQLDPGDPAPEIWSAETSWWRLIVDGGTTEHDARIEAAVARTIELADARLMAWHRRATGSVA